MLIIIAEVLVLELHPFEPYTVMTPNYESILTLRTPLLKGRHPLRISEFNAYTNLEKGLRKSYYGARKGRLNTTTKSTNLGYLSEET